MIMGKMDRDGRQMKETIVHISVIPEEGTNWTRKILKMEKIFPK